MHTVSHSFSNELLDERTSGETIFRSRNVGGSNVASSPNPKVRFVAGSGGLGVATGVPFSLFLLTRKKCRTGSKLSHYPITIYWTGCIQRTSGLLRGLAENFQHRLGLSNCSSARQTFLMAYGQRQLQAALLTPVAPLRYSLLLQRYVHTYIHTYIYILFRDLF